MFVLIWRGSLVQPFGFYLIPFCQSVLDGFSFGLIKTRIRESLVLCRGMQTVFQREAVSSDGTGWG